jgi:hypothetical protein
MKPFCTGCNTPGDQIEEYIEGAKEAEMPVDDYIREEEGTYNPANGHFLCTSCYIDAGMPSAPVGQPGWIAP